MVCPLAVVLAVALAATSAPVAQTRRPTNHARVSLLAHQPHRGGLTLGVRFELEDGWRIYWRNPGGAGSPPEFRWTLAPAFTVGSVRWPLPSRLVTNGVVGYGYERDVLLPFSAQRTRPQTGATIAVAVDYVICRDVCVKESASASLYLPAGGATRLAEDDAARFARAASRLPESAPLSWKPSALASDDEIVLHLTARGLQGTIEFLPFVNGLIDDGAPQRRVDANGRVSLFLRKAPGYVHPPSTLDGLVVVADTRSFLVRAPLSR
ncbi:MAG: protein-disulfide reductase DsbD domain-containing protein [Vicinamibacterales bacterium]